MNARYFGKRRKKKGGVGVLHVPLCFWELSIQLRVKLPVFLVSIDMVYLYREPDLDLETFSLGCNLVWTLDGRCVMVRDVPAGAAVSPKGGISCRTTERVRPSRPCQSSCDTCGENTLSKTH